MGKAKVVVQDDQEVLEIVQEQSRVIGEVILTDIWFAFKVCWIIERHF
jgi:hypothetical protein